MINEFSNDWENADRFYQGKSIKISGVCFGINRAIDPVSIGALGVGSIAMANEFPIFENQYEFIELIKNNITISCHFNELAVFNLNPSDRLILIGDYYNFRNSIIAKAIILKNCVVLENANAKLIFWRYNKSVSFEKFCSYQLNDLPEKLEIAFEIKLDEFDLYLWDEQILRMSSQIFKKNNYANKFLQIEKNSDLGSLYFSVIINGKIVFNGLNRVRIFQTATMQPYDASKYPRISILSENQSYILSENQSYIYFRFTDRPALFLKSIWDMPKETGNIELLFVEEIYNYFELRKNIQRGKFDINELYEEGILTRISNN